MQICLGPKGTSLDPMATVPWGKAPENATHTKLKNRGRMVLVTPVAGPLSPLQWQSLSRFSVHDEVILGMGRGLGTYCFLGKLFCIGRGHK